MTEPALEWDFGDPLPGARRGAQHQGFLYNFRDIPDSEHCTCMDRARWPVPFGAEIQDEEWFMEKFREQMRETGG